MIKKAEALLIGNEYAYQSGNFVAVVTASGLLGWSMTFTCPEGFERGWLTLPGAPSFLVSRWDGRIGHRISNRVAFPYQAWFVEVRNIHARLGKETDMVTGPLTQDPWEGGFTLILFLTGGAKHCTSSTTWVEALPTRRVDRRRVGRMVNSSLVGVSIFESGPTISWQGQDHAGEHCRVSLEIDQNVPLSKDAFQVLLGDIISRLAEVGVRLSAERQQGEAAFEGLSRYWQSARVRL